MGIKGINVSTEQDILSEQIDDLDGPLALKIADGDNIFVASGPLEFMNFAFLQIFPLHNGFPVPDSPDMNFRKIHFEVLTKIGTYNVILVC